MATIKEIRKASLDNFKKHYSSSIVLSLVCGLLILVLISIGATEIGPALMVLIVPLVILPFIFATQVAHFGLREKIAPSFRLQMRFFFAYFSLPFRGVYSVLKSFLFALLTFAVLTSVCSVFANMICADIFTNFTDIQNQIMTLINSGNTTDLAKILEDNSVMLMIYMDIATLPALFLAFLLFVIMISYNSLQVYLRIKVPNLNHSYARYVYNYAKASIYGKIMSAYWALNFPLYILLVLGFAGGIGIGLSFTVEYTYLATLGVAGAIALMIFFLPFYFSNMESIYLAYEDIFKAASKKATDDIINHFEREVDSLKQRRDLDKDRSSDVTNDNSKDENKDENK